MLYEKEKNFRYHEFYTDSENFLKDISKLLSLGYESETIEDDKGNVIKEPLPNINENWEMIYPVVDKIEFPEVQDWDKLTPAEYKKVTYHQINKIEDTVILKAKTSPKEVNQKRSSSLGFDEDSLKETTEIYLEIYFPPYLCDSEIQDPFRQRNGEIPTVSTRSGNTITSRNFHHAYFRLFDEINEDKTGPKPNVVDTVTRTVIKWNSRQSEWSKLSWYNDFENIYQDKIIDGSFRCCVQPGITAQTKIKIWANVNRDRLVLAVMGSPNIDFSEDRYAIASAYIGSIESFDFSVNDTAGNFGIYTTSTSIPSIAKTTTKTSTPVKFTESVVGYGGTADGVYTIKTAPKTIYNNSNTIKVILPVPTDIPEKEGVYWGERFIDVSSIVPSLVFNFEDGKHGTFYDANNAPVFDFKFASDTIKVDEYSLISDTTSRKFVEIGIKQSDIIDQMRKLSGYPQQDILRAVANSAPTIQCEFKVYTEQNIVDPGVKRDAKGHVVAINYPTTYGKNTANGTTDFSMYHTFGKDYFQKHYFMFASTEEYMQKELYGKSVYTGEYFADRIKIVHGSEGPRGMLRAMIAIESSSLYPFDELIVNKDFEKHPDKPEELFVYLPVTTQHCPFTNSPNAMFGIGILKDIRYNTPVTDQEKVDAAIRELTKAYEDLEYVTDDIALISKSRYGTEIKWASSSEEITIEEVK